MLTELSWLSSNSHFLYARIIDCNLACWVRCTQGVRSSFQTVQWNVGCEEIVNTRAKAPGVASRTRK
jgi:hypothetical protein